MARPLPLRTRFQRDASELEAYFDNFARRHPELDCCMLRYQPEIGPELDSPLVRYLSCPSSRRSSASTRGSSSFTPTTRRRRWRRPRSPARCGAPVNVAPDRLDLAEPGCCGCAAAVAPDPAPAVRAGARRGSAASSAPAPLYGDGVRLLRYGRGVDNRRLRDEVGFEPRYDAESARSRLRRARSRAVGSARRFTPATSRAAWWERAVSAAAARRNGPHRRCPRRPRSPTSCAGCGSGVEDGLDPLSAAAGRGRRAARRLRDAVERHRAPAQGEYREDEWGFDEGFAEAVYPLFEFLYDVWWRVEAEGVRNVPAHGRALLVANHAGSLFPFDASMMLGAIMKRHPLPRWPRFMVLDWAFVLPFLSTLHAPGRRGPRQPAQRRPGCSSRTSW